MLSDSGIGREMHVIVGQGQLDAVLQARPEDRRGFVEEAAGVLKHRKRKEKALRKLEAMQANLTRVTDLTAELRRQLKPLGKQAEIARRAAGVQAELRDSRLRLLADDLLTLRDELEREVADEEAIRARRAEVENALAAARARESELETRLAADAELVARTQDTWYRLSALEERFRGTVSLAAERARHLAAAPEEIRTGREPEAMEAEAAEMRTAEAALQAELDGSRQELADVVQTRQGLEARLAEAERAVVAAVRAVADRREGVARLAGQVNALRSRLAAAQEESERLSAAAADARERAAGADAELARVQEEVGVLDAGELGLDTRHEQAVAAYERVQSRVRELTDAERDTERERSTWTARADALVVGLTGKDGSAALLGAGEQLSGVVGSLATLVTVDAGYQTAIAAALGTAADAVVVDGVDSAVAALAHLKAEEAGRAGLVLRNVGDPARSGGPALPPGARAALDLVRTPPELRGALALLLHDVVIVDDVARARELLGSGVASRVVTREGDVFGPGWVQGGSSSAPSAIEISAAVDEARQNADAAAARHEQDQSSNRTRPSPSLICTQPGRLACVASRPHYSSPRSPSRPAPHRPRTAATAATTRRSRSASSRSSTSHRSTWARRRASSPRGIDLSWPAPRAARRSCRASSAASSSSASATSPR